MKNSSDLKHLISQAKKEYKELEADLGNFQNWPKEKSVHFGELAKIIDLADDLEKTDKDIAEIVEMSANEEIKKEAEEELEKLEDKKRSLLAKIQEFFGIGGKKKENELILEIRAGAGGDEASLFAQDLFNMYERYAAKNSWLFKVVYESKNELGGYKEVVAEIKGEDAYKKLKNESGVHRIQRVPVTEKSGRIHTSTASVAVLPVAKEKDIEIKPDELEISFSRAGGPGGQNVNKVESAVRIMHKPTGIVVSCREERSQIKNREKALTILRTKLLDEKSRKSEMEIGSLRKEQIGTQDRSEKIRTYNILQDRVTDHRLKKSWHNIEKIFAGDLDPIVEAFKN